MFVHLINIKQFYKNKINTEYLLIHLDQIDSLKERRSTMLSLHLMLRVVEDNVIDQWVL